MNLTLNERKSFYKCWYALIWAYNEKHHVIPHFDEPKHGVRVAVSLEEFKKVRDSLWNDSEWIEEFLAKNNNGRFTEEERAMMISWGKNFIKGKFLCVKHLSNYSVLMTYGGEPEYLFAVGGISDSFENSFSNQLPFLLDLVLLPWGDKIIYDSLAELSRISFGPGIRKSVNESYSESKKKFGIIDTLGMRVPLEKQAKKKQSVKEVKETATSENRVPKVKVPEAMLAKYQDIAEVISGFAKEALNEEYEKLCLNALAKLCRKRPSPLLRGNPITWACGIVYAIGSNNFIFDRAQEISMTATDIADWFGLSKSTAGSKGAEVTKLIHISKFDPEFTLAKIAESDPLLWIINVNGYLLDIRNAPYEFQKEAFEHKLIPYIPNERK